jgi:hypothetical protein
MEYLQLPNPFLSINLSISITKTMSITPSLARVDPVPSYGIRYTSFINKRREWAHSHFVFKNGSFLNKGDQYGHNERNFPLTKRQSSTLQNIFNSVRTQFRFEKQQKFFLKLYIT